LQGYYFSKPVQAADVPGLLSRRWEMNKPEPGHAPTVPSSMPG